MNLFKVMDALWTHLTISKSQLSVGPQKAGDPSIPTRATKPVPPKVFSSANGVETSSTAGMKPSAVITFLAMQSNLVTHATTILKHRNNCFSGMRIIIPMAASSFSHSIFAPSLCHWHYRATTSGRSNSYAFDLMAPAGSISTRMSGTKASFRFPVHSVFLTNKGRFTPGCLSIFLANSAVYCKWIFTRYIGSL